MPTPFQIDYVNKLGQIYPVSPAGPIGPTGPTGPSGAPTGATGTTGASGTSDIVKIAYIEESGGIIHFEPYDTSLQIEVYKYTTKSRGEHIHKNGTIYTNRIGKRYHILYQIARGATSWTMPTKYVLHEKKNYFKFGFFNIDTKVRTPLSSLTIQTVNGGGNSKILILG